jgi:hypothetical protein
MVGAVEDGITKENNNNGSAARNIFFIFFYKDKDSDKKALVNI